MVETLYKCPKCEHLISEQTYLQIKYDYDCSQCRARRISEYVVGTRNKPDIIPEQDIERLPA